MNLNNRHHQKHHANSLKSFDEFDVENRKIVLIEKNTHAETESNSKREKVNILEMIRAV